MLEEELKQKGLEVMEEELIYLENEVRYAEHEISNMVEQVNYWKDKLTQARKNFDIASEKYDEKFLLLKEVRKLIKC